jgi:hypothetical protein
MMVIGVDPHKQTRTAVAAGELGRKKAQRTVRARRDGHRELIAWARELAPAGRLWAGHIRHSTQINPPAGPQSTTCHGVSPARTGTACRPGRTP